MSDATGQFFEELGQRGYEPLIAKFSGRVRFDVTDADHVEHWLVEIDKGNVAVSRQGGEGDCTIRADKALFDRLATGEEHAMAAALRGALVCTGDVELLLAIQRVFPGPARTAEPDGREQDAMSSDQIRILDGNTFVVSDDRGDIEASLTDPTGLFSFDTRFLSKWILSVNEQRLTALSVDDHQYFETKFFLVPGTGTVYVDSKLSVIRHRTVGDGFHEQLTLQNHEHDPVDLTIRIEADCDFADLFEVKDALPKKGRFEKLVDTRELVLAYQRETFSRSTVISSTETCAYDENGLTFQIRLDPHAMWTTTLHVRIDLSADGRRRRRRREGARVAIPTTAPEHGTRSGALDRSSATGRVRQRAR